MSKWYKGFKLRWIYIQVNRKFIVSIVAIVDMVKLSRSRIRLSLHPPVVSGAEVIVSEDRSNDFQRWLGE